MFIKMVSRIEETIVGIIMVILVILTSVNVILRYIFDYSITGSVEISILLFAWIIFLGSSMAFKYKSHITIELFETILPLKIKRFISIIINLTLIIFFTIMCVYGFIFTYDVWGETLGASNIPKALVYLSFPIGFGLMEIHLINQLVTAVKEMRGEKK